jgi:hypothetical protein
MGKNHDPSFRLVQTRCEFLVLKHHLDICIAHLSTGKTQDSCIATNVQERV